MNHIRVQLSLALAMCLFVGSARAADKPAAITTPKEQFGFNIGDDFCLANYKQLEAYWHKLEGQTDRLKVVSIGKTEEGRDQLMAIVTSPANHAKLAHYRDISRRMALAKGISRDDARKLAEEGKAVIWIDGGLHATEVLCAQMLIETIYQFVSANDPETLRILDDVIILFVHANPDGMDLVSDNYMNSSQVPEQRRSGNLPRLYQKYAGHDNNRDLGSNLAETRNMNRVMFREWVPQIMYNHHQSGPAGTVLFCPPFRDPSNYNLHPLMTSGLDAVGAAMMQRFLLENKPGATVRSGAPYATWWNGGLRTTTCFHNIIGLLTETVGSPNPSSIPYRPQMQLPRGDFLAPVAPQEWHFRQSVDYSVTANKAILDYASRHRSQMLFNIWHMGQDSIAKGSRDNWTVSPKMVAAAEAAGGGGGPAEFEKFFRDPAKRDPRAFILPADQPDFLTATKFVNRLMSTGCTIHRATADFRVAGKGYPQGSYVVKSAQAFRPHVIDLFEPQDYPNDFIPGSTTPIRPYDIAGWTLAFQMAVKFDRIMDGFDGPFEELKDEVPPPPGRVTNATASAGFFLDTQMNDAFKAVNRLLAAGEDVLRLEKPFMMGLANYPAGTFFVARKASTQAAVEKIAREVGTPFHGRETVDGLEAVTLKAPRIGLFDTGNSMPAGWTRWILERFEFPYQTVNNAGLGRGNLRDRFDVLLFVEGGVGGGGGRGGGGRGAGRGGAGGDQPPDQEQAGADTTTQLRKFLEDGGIVFTSGSATNLARQLGLPLGNHLAGLNNERFYVPGSVLQTKVDQSNWLTYGMDDHVDVMFNNSPTFRVPDGDAAKGLKKVAWFENKTPLRSGWAWGQEHLDGGVAVAEAQIGKGRLVLCGPQVLFRAQPDGTFKYLFNTITQAGRKE